MKILYGIQLNGNGHITRSIEIINSLRKSGHEVDIISSGDNYSIEVPENTKKFKGLSLYFDKGGRISKIKTIKSLFLNIFNLIKDIKYVKNNYHNYDIIISDFEPISAYLAKINKIKSIGISNQASITKSNTFEKLFTKHFAPCQYYIPIGYNDKYKPIISEKILKGKVANDNFYLVYLPSYSLKYIINQLEYSNNNFKVYTNEILENIPKNIELKNIDKESFQSDLLNCSGVITASGFSTTSEALVIGKKLWSIPIKGQFEQLDNAIKLNKMGVYIEDFSSKNLENWIKNYHPIKYNWENPLDLIINKITEINGN